MEATKQHTKTQEMQRTWANPVMNREGVVTRDLLNTAGLGGNEETAG